MNKFYRVSTAGTINSHHPFLLSCLYTTYPAMLKLKLKLTASILLLTIFASAQVLTSTNLPIIVINTNGQDIVDDPKIMADMGIIWNANDAVNNITDPFNHYNGKIGIEIRGQSSQMFPMKSYSVELWNSSGNSINSSLFNMPSESDWVLYAPYNDKTLMHNFLAYNISQQMGHWASHCRYVELVINNEYKGIYVFMEKIKRKASRVNVPSMSSTDNTGDAVTGGYIFSIDKGADGWYSSYPAGTGSIQFAHVYPKLSNITVQQQTYIKNYTDSFENALHTTNYMDTSSGWRKYADEASFIDFFLVNELSRNVDGYRISTYFHKDRKSNGGKIKAGPVWDYDIAFRNADYCNGSDTTGWAFNFNNICQDYYMVPDWWKIFMTDTTFQSNLYCRWKELRSTTLSTANLYHLIDSITTLTEDARTRHFQQWPVLGIYVWPNPSPIPADYEGEIQTLKTWLADRINWLDHHIPVTGKCVPPPVPPVVPPIISTDSSDNISITTFPNPVSTSAQVVIESGQSQTLTLRVTDMIGRTTHRSTIALTRGTNYIQVASGAWAKGIYFFEFSGTNSRKITKLALKQ
ncbi:MAG: CotH kinase family protein [Bacteroidetes bacterium]|nr:CotH kinase family protein [Bacteroidota bacterium]